MASIKPYQNETESLSIGGLTVENRTDRVEIYGSLHLTRDKQGLGDARSLKALLESVVKALETEKALPEKVELTNKPKLVKNPFA